MRETIVYVNEFTLWRLLFEALRRRRPLVAGVEGLFPPTEAVLRRLVDALRRCGGVRDLIDEFPAYKHVLDQPATIYIYDIFARTEAWHNARYGIADSDQPLPEYGMAIRNVAAKYPVKRHLPILLLHEASRRHGAHAPHIIGVPDDMAEQYEAYHGEALPRGVASRAGAPMSLINALPFLFVVLAGMVWIAARTRTKVTAERFFFAADYLEDVRDMRLYEEIEEGGPILLVVRWSRRGFAAFPRLEQYRRCRAGDGRFTPVAAAAAAAVVFRDTWRLFWRHRRQPSGLLYQIVALPMRRIMLRAFFARFKPRYFWGRDDYNVEHVLRRQEIHRIGGESIGIIHGSPGVAILEPMWRYTSFDHYFVFGRAIHDYFKDTWAHDMTVTPIGTFGARREDYARIGEPLPRNVIVFTSVFGDSDKLPSFVGALARAFPDRRIILSPKSTAIHQDGVRRITAACLATAPNIEVVSPDVPFFERLRMARYALSDPSTTLIEAMQFGLFSFFIDLSERQRACVYRRFPDLWLKTPEDAVARIHDLENGVFVYRRESYGSLVALHGQVYFDAVRERLGLAAKEPAIPIAERLARVASCQEAV